MPPPPTPIHTSIHTSIHRPSLSLPFLLILLWQVCAIQSSPCTPPLQRLLPRSPSEPSRCAACPPGLFSPASTLRCGPCPPGHGSHPLTPGLTCIPCLPGTFSNTSGNAPCTVCPPGSHSDRAATKCTPCKDAKFSPGNAACTKCNPGSVWTLFNVQGKRNESVWQCAPCEPGYFAVDRFTCQKCPMGSYQPDWGQRQCLPCNPGSYADQEGLWRCKPCEKHSIAPERAATKCMPCVGRSVSYGGGRVCTPSCGEGSVRDGVNCIVCRKGTGYNPEKDRCDACEKGVTSRDVSSGCAKCDVGQLPTADRTTCECEPGLLKEKDRKGDLQCVPCPPGASSPDGDTCVCTGNMRLQNGVCVCRPGFKRLSTGEGCHPCTAKEKKAPYESGNQCTFCAPGSGLYRGEGGVECRHCTDGVNQFFNLRACQECKGTAFPDETNTMCVCADGYEADAGGCKACPPGTFKAFPYNSCTKCLPDTFSPEKASNDCKRCPRGTRSYFGWSSCTSCPHPRRFIPPGKCICQSSHILVDGRCEKCPSNRQADPTGEICICSYGREWVENKCKPCPPGTFSQGLGVCAKCEVGSYSPGGFVPECISCMKGTEAPMEGMSRCVPKCAEGEFRNADGMCASCEKGYFVKNGVCTKCPPGMASEGGDAIMCERCKPPAVEQDGICLTGARTSCQGESVRDLTTGSCQECWPGSRAVAGKCEPCEPGFAGVGCKKCTDGVSTGSGGQSCEKCPPGTKPVRGVECVRK